MLKYHKSIFFGFLLIFVGIGEGNSQSIGGTTTGGITDCDTINSGFLSLTGYTGTILSWESSTDSLVWVSTSNDLNVQSYSSVKQTTWYRAIVQDGAFSPDTSTVSKITIYPSSEGGIISGGGIFCGGTGSGTLSLSGNVDSILYWQYSTDNGISWTKEANTTNTLNYTDFSEDRLYTAVAQSNPVCPVDTSSQASFLFSPSVGGTLSEGGLFCDSSGVGTLSLTGEVGTILNWQYSIDSGSTWVSISNSSSLLNYPNITQATLYEVVVQLGACPPDSSSQASISFNPTVKGILSGIDSVCAGTNAGMLELEGHTGGVLTWLSSIDEGVNWSEITNLTSSLEYTNLMETTWYKTVVQNETCPKDTSDYLEVVVNPLPVVFAGNDTTIGAGGFALLNGIGGGVPSWSPEVGLDSVGIFTPTASPEFSTTYILTVKDSNSCTQTDLVYINVHVAEFGGVVTNLISANNDGVNDTWVIEGIQNFPDNEVFVFNIFGKQVFSIKGYVNDWDATFNGEPLPDGTYFYVLSFGNSGEIYKGSLDVIR